MWTAVALLILAHVVVAITGKREWSATSDEIAYMLSGHSYWQERDFRLQPENGNLPQRLEGLPAWLEGAKLPAATSPFWATSDQWRLGYVYFYKLGNNLDRMLRDARAMNLIWSIGLGVLIFAWARSLFGTAGGFVALGFFCIDPSFLAHGALATSDTCMAFFMLAAVGAWWRYLNRGGFGAGLLSALVFGLACVAKFSAVLLIPMFLVLVLVYEIRRRGAEVVAIAKPVRSIRKWPLAILGHAAVAIAIIWASFNFRYSAISPSAPPFAHFIKEWSTMITEIGWQGRVLQFLRSWHALPEAFLYGYNHVISFSQQRAAFLDGEYSIYGWVRFFPLAFLYKTTLALLVALFLCATLTLRRWRTTPGAWRRDLYRAAPLVTLFVIYWAFSLTIHLNIGHRHILPICPVLFIFAGAIGWAAAQAAMFRWIAAVILLAGVVEVARVHPHELAFFNALSGGPENGHKHLVDSSLDWGQDLPGLRRWLDEHPLEQPVYLSYFGTGEPDYYHIHARRLWFLNGLEAPQKYVPLEPGTYCIGATILEHVYSPVRGPWTMKLEKEYQALRELEPTFAVYENDPKRRAEMDREASPDTWQRAIMRHEILRLARLCFYLRARQPDDNVGYSIFIYRLNADEIAAATGPSLKAWGAAIEQAMNGQKPHAVSR